MSHRNSTFDRRGIATGFGLGAVGKIHDHHLDRLAVVYVRQSSPQQVIEHRESRERQYALAGFAERLGWPAERVLVIDDDQGQSAKTAENRLGFQRLMTEVSLNHVGMILGLELSRLARSSKDWHQLVDVCCVFQTLLCDEDAVYDPLDSNDRLLLGMRGAMSEYELVTLKNRLLRGSRNKAERGELFLRLPVGYVKLPTGEVIQEPDEQARGMVQLVFDKFQELGSAYAVYQYFLGNDFELGFRVPGGPHQGELRWRSPKPTRILWILKHPFYAGAYAYGIHRAGTKNPVSGKAEGGKWFVPPDEMQVFLPDRLPAYISWEQYLANQAQLKQNRSLPDSRGVPRQGEALLTGLVVCGKCGYRMGTNHKERRYPAYQCTEHWHRPWEEPCGGVRAQPVDELVAQEALRALEPAALELSLKAAAHGDQERQRLHEQWQKKRERARQDAERAERQYQVVEPENRLVARTLEARWEAALAKQREVEEEYHRFAAKLPRTLSDADRERIRRLAGSVADLWNAPETGMADRKQIVRCLIDQVLVISDRCSELVHVTIQWQGGFSSEHQIARPIGSYQQLNDYEKLVARIRELHQRGCHVPEIAKTLNEEGFVPPRRRGKYSVNTLAPLMEKLGLVGELFRDTLLKQDEWWAADLARKLKVTHQKIRYWAKQGWVHSRRSPSGRQWIVWADAEEMHRLRKLRTKKNSWLAAKHPELVVPKSRPPKK